MNGHQQAVQFDTEEKAARAAQAFHARTGHKPTVMSLGDGGGGPIDYWFLSRGLTQEDLSEADIELDADNNLIDNS